MTVNFLVKLLVSDQWVTQFCRMQACQRMRDHSPGQRGGNVRAGHAEAGGPIRLLPQGRTGLPQRQVSRLAGLPTVPRSEGQE